MVPTLRESSGISSKSGKVGGKSEKVREFYILKSKENKRVRESRGKLKYHCAKDNKDAEKILNCFTQTAYNSSKNFSAHFTHRLFVSSLLNLFYHLCLCAIESQHWYFA